MATGENRRRAAGGGEGMENVPLRKLARISQVSRQICGPQCGLISVRQHTSTKLKIDVDLQKKRVFRPLMKKSGR